MWTEAQLTMRLCELQVAQLTTPQRIQLENIANAIAAIANRTHHLSGSDTQNLTLRQINRILQVTSRHQLESDETGVVATSNTVGVYWAVGSMLAIAGFFVSWLAWSVAGLSILLGLGLMSLIYYLSRREKVYLQEQQFQAEVALNEAHDQLITVLFDNDLVACLRSLLQHASLYLDEFDQAINTKNVHLLEIQINKLKKRPHSLKIKQFLDKVSKSCAYARQAALHASTKNRYAYGQPNPSETPRGSGIFWTSAISGFILFSAIFDIYWAVSVIPAFGLSALLAASPLLGVVLPLVIGVVATIAAVSVGLRRYQVLQNHIKQKNDFLQTRYLAILLQKDKYEWFDLKQELAKKATGEHVFEMEHISESLFSPSAMARKLKLPATLTYNSKLIYGTLFSDQERKFNLAELIIIYERDQEANVEKLKILKELTERLKQLKERTRLDFDVDVNKFSLQQAFDISFYEQNKTGYFAENLVGLSTSLLSTYWALSSIMGAESLFISAVVFSISAFSIVAGISIAFCLYCSKKYEEDAAIQRNFTVEALLLTRQLQYKKICEVVQSHLIRLQKNLFPMSEKITTVADDECLQLQNLCNRIKTQLSAHPHKDEQHLDNCMQQLETVSAQLSGFHRGVHDAHAEQIPLIWNLKRCWYSFMRGFTFSVATISTYWCLISIPAFGIGALFAPGTLIGLVALAVVVGVAIGLGIWFGKSQWNTCGRVQDLGIKNAQIEQECCCLQQKIQSAYALIDALESAQQHLTHKGQFNLFDDYIHQPTSQPSFDSDAIELRDSHRPLSRPDEFELDVLTLPPRPRSNIL